MTVKIPEIPTVCTTVLTLSISRDTLYHRCVLCDSLGMRTRTGKTFASMMFGLKPQFLFSTTPARLRSVTIRFPMRNAG